MKQSGLSTKEAKNLLSKHGRNELVQKKKVTHLDILIDQFKSPLVYILMVAVIITLLLHEYKDSIVIAITLSINAILGFWQEQKAENTLDHLKSLLVPKALVIRDGKQKTIDASLLVPGDLVILSTDYQIPADGKVIESSNVFTAEAMLTGESVPIEKEIDDMVYAGTTLVEGIGKMIVGKTGMNTKMGEIGKQVIDINNDKTPLQVQLDKLAKFLGGICVAITVGIFILGISRGYHVLEMFETSIAIAVASIPEGLIISFTVILAIGMQKILSQKAIVRRLISAETLGSVSVICADKTGTLTEGIFKVARTEFVNNEMGLKAAVLCNNLIDPLEIASMNWAESRLTKLNQKKSSIINSFERIHTIAFNSLNKFTATLHKDLENKKQNILFTFGAPEVIIERSYLSKKERLHKLEELKKLTKSGYRVTSYAYKIFDKSKSTIKPKEVKDLTWLGYICYEDPTRKDLQKVFEDCNTAGIKVKIITGDYLSTAISVIRKAGLHNKLSETELEQKSITGKEIENMTDEELRGVVGDIVLFARTRPKHKLRIVKALKENGEVVAMMGDGINDAPALKKSDIGIVVNEASDVSKEISDIILLDSNFKTIVGSIRQGRVIFENIKKVVLFLLFDSFTELLLIGGSTILKLPLPITAAQILWINLIEDSFPSITLAFEKGDDNLMKIPPRHKDTPILSKSLKIVVFSVGIGTDLILFGFYFYLMNQGRNIDEIRSLIFLATGLNSFFYIFGCKSLTKPIYKVNIFDNKRLLGAVLLALGLVLATIYVPFLSNLLTTFPPTTVEWLALIGLGLFDLIAIEITKTILLRRNNNAI